MTPVPQGGLGVALVMPAGEGRGLFGGRRDLLQTHDGVTARRTMATKQPTPWGPLERVLNSAVAHTPAVCPTFSHRRGWPRPPGLNHHPGWVIWGEGQREARGFPGWRRGFAGAQCVCPLNCGSRTWMVRALQTLLVTWARSVKC